MRKRTEKNKWFEEYPIDNSLGKDYFVHFSAKHGESLGRERKELIDFTQTESAIVLQDKSKVEASSRSFFKSIKADPIDHSTPVEKQPNGFIKI